MQTRRMAAFALAALLVGLSACSLPVSPFVIPGLGTGTPTPTGSQVPSATPLVPELTVTSATNCRTGPSDDYDLVFTANPGPSYTIIGVYNRGGYWIVANPLGGTCWLWGQNAVVSGNTAGLPAYPAPPLPHPKATKAPKPSAPGDLSGSKTCTAGLSGTTRVWVEGVTLSWKPSDGEIGYRIYRDDTSVATVPAGATSYFIQFRYDQGAGGPQSDTFGVEAFNDSGTSARVSVNVPRCP